MNEKADYPRAGKWFSANSYLSFIFRLEECIFHGLEYTFHGVECTFQPMEYKTYIAVSGLLIVFLKKMILCIRKQKIIFPKDYFR